MSEYPRHLKKPGGAYLVVNNDQEKADGLAAGWVLRLGQAGGVTPAPESLDAAPIAPDLVGVVLSSPLAAGAGQTGETVTIEAQAPKKRGRKPKS